MSKLGNLFSRKRDELADKGFTDDFRGMSAVVYVFRRDGEPSMNDTLLELVDVEGMELANLFEDARVHERLGKCLDFVCESNVHTLVVGGFSDLGSDAGAACRNFFRLVENSVNVFFYRENFHTHYRNRRPRPEAVRLLSVLKTVVEMGPVTSVTQRDEAWDRYNKVEKRQKRAEKYGKAIEFLKMGFSPREVVEMCEDEGLKVSVATVWGLRRDFVEYGYLFDGNDR